MRLRWPLLVGFLAGTLIASCGGTKVDPKTLNGTALFVTCFFNADYHVRSLLFTGDTADGNDAFQRGSRPEPASTTDLNGPLTARILLKDALADQELAITVYALDANGEIVEVGTANVKVVGGRETDVRVNLAPFVVAPVDAGSDAGTDAGVFDAGVLDAGVRADGGTACDCTSGCCILGANPDGGACAPTTSASFPLEGNAPPFLVTGQFCGRSGFACTVSDFCDPMRANTCAGAKCSCGTLGAPCAPGMRCTLVGSVAACLCDKYSNCDGCCSAQNQCVTLVDSNACGAGGLACQKCVSATGVAPKCEGALWGTGACANFQNCLQCDQIDKCCNGNQCAGGGFPVCRARPPGVPSVCESCDLLRSNRCHPVTGQCACGDAGPCNQGQTCKEGTCKAIF